MVLLTILAVGLLTLSSISLRASSRDEAMATARANARMSLIMAIGELQKQAGPDQRATGTADLAGVATGDPLAVGTAPLNNTSVNSISKGLSMIQPGTRYWTGVWNQTEAANRIYTRTPSPILKAWLISGNEGLKAGSRLTPASTIASVDSSGKVSDSTKAVVLVGKNSAGSADSARFVGAPLVQIGGVNKDGKASSNPAGRHGWWIGDEGVKAKFNQVPGDNPSQEMNYLTMGDRRAGWEAVAGFGDYPTPKSGAGKTIAKVVTVPEGGLLNQAFAAKGAADSPLQQNFHALTVDSVGLLTDALNGGLRVDMTPYLRNGFPDGVGTTTIVPRTVASRMKAPTWNRIKEFADMYQALDSGKLIVKPAANDLSVAVSPVIAELRFLFGVRPVPVDGDPNGFKLNTCVKVAVTLANPYPYPLKWNSALEMEVTNPQPNAGYQTASIYDAAQGATGRPAFVPRDASQPAALNNVFFRIPTDEIPAGEAKAFTIGAPAYRAAGSVAKTTVDLKPFGSASPANFDNCMEQAHDATNNLSTSLAMDMRESWTTTQITVNLRTGSGSNNLLRRIERFELDNAYYATTKRPIDATKARVMKRPFAIHYFRFQYSQPGNDYGTLLPKVSGSPDPLGLRSSTLRSFADFNVQGKRFHKAITSYNPTPYFMQSVDTLNDLPYNEPGGETGGAFTRDLAITPISWGRSPSDTKKVILFSPQQKFVSLAQLQHADLTGDDVFASVGHQPGNAVGNSYATPFVKRSSVIENRGSYYLTGSGDAYTTETMNYYDIAYLLNTALWDNYYFSALPASGPGDPESPAIIKIHPGQDSTELHDAKLAARHLVIDGAFNVNSTRKEAWKALFAGSKHLKHAADSAASSSDALYPRSLEQKNPAATPPTGEMEDSYAGFRRLTDAQLDALAEEMTRQVRLRGPFVSMAQFVNRAIADLSRNKALSRSGALQSALDESGVNINVAGSKNAFKNITITEDRLNLQANGSAPRGDLDGPRATGAAQPPGVPDPVWAPSSKDLNPGAMSAILSDRAMLTSPALRQEQGFRSTGIPGWVTQADILQVIGPALAVRSDTFRVRAYGEATDPVTGVPIARAWCEAIVQRMPDYVDPNEAASKAPAELQAAANKIFGRRFEMVSFKWLSKDEI